MEYGSKKGKAWNNQTDHAANDSDAAFRDGRYTVFVNAFDYEGKKSTREIDVIVNNFVQKVQTLVFYIPGQSIPVFGGSEYLANDQLKIYVVPRTPGLDYLPNMTPLSTSQLLGEVMTNDDGSIIPAAFEYLMNGDMWMVADYDNDGFFIDELDGSSLMRPYATTQPPPETVPVDDDITGGGSSTGNGGIINIDPVAIQANPNQLVLSVTGFTQPSSGTVTQNPNGTLTFTPASGFYGSVYFYVSITDEYGRTVTLTIRITVENCNPKANEDIATAFEDGTVMADLRSNDRDCDQDELLYNVLLPAAHGTFEFTEEDQISYRPDTNFAGMDVMVFEVTDGRGGRDLSYLYITVQPVQDPIVAHPDLFSGDEDVTIIDNVRINDDDPDGDDLHYEIVNGPQYGSFELDANGRFVYIPADNWHGQDTAIYSVSDGHGSIDTAEVTFTIASVNDVPTATATQINVQKGTISSISLQSFITDAEGDPLEFSLNVPAAGGTISDFASNGNFAFVPNEGFFGPTEMQIRVNDGQSDDVLITFTLFVNAAPVVLSEAFSISRGELVYGNVTANDQDINDDVLQVAMSTSPAHGQVTLLGQGLFIYKPESGWWGEDTFEYQVSDGRGGSATGTVTVTVLESEAAPPPVGGYNGNGGQLQRSRLTTVTLEFEEAVDASTLSGAGGIILTRTTALTPAGIGTIVQTGATGNLGRVTVTQNNTRSITLTFDNADGANVSGGVEYGSFADGRWLLAIPSLGYHTTVGDTNLRRLFGDINNDGTVDGSDLQAFASAFGTNAGMQSFNAAFDFNNDGIIDGTDFNQFGNRFGLAI